MDFTATVTVLETEKVGIMIKQIKKKNKNIHQN